MNANNRSTNEFTTDQFMSAGKTDIGELTKDQFTETYTV
jgi:hypothetical protein